MVDPTQAVGGVGGGVGAAVGATVGTTAEAAPALVCRWCGETALVELIAPVIFCSVCGRVSPRGRRLERRPDTAPGMTG